MLLSACFFFHVRMHVVYDCLSYPWPWSKVGGAASLLLTMPSGVNIRQNVVPNASACRPLSPKTLSSAHIKLRLTVRTAPWRVSEEEGVYLNTCYVPGVQGISQSAK